MGKSYYNKLVDTITNRHSKKEAWSAKDVQENMNDLEEMRKYRTIENH